MSVRYSNGLRQARRRARIEAAIQRAIDLLDAMDADPDAEPDADDDDPAEAWMQPVKPERSLERDLRHIAPENPFSFLPCSIGAQVRGRGQEGGALP